MANINNKKKNYTLFTVKAWQQTFNIFKAFGYMNSGRWEPPKFFVSELCNLYDIFIWFIFFGTTFERGFFNHRLINPWASALYLIVDLYEYNELISKQIDRTKDFNMDVDFLLMKPRVTYLDIKLPNNQDLLTLENERLQQQQLQNIQELEELNEFWRLHPWSKKIPQKKPKLIFNLLGAYQDLFPYDSIHNRWFCSNFKKDTYFYNSKQEIFTPYAKDLYLNFLEWLNLINVIRSYVHRWVWGSVKLMLFEYATYSFATQFFFLKFLWLKLLKNYFKLTNFLYKPTALDNRSKVFYLPLLQDLELPQFFFEPLYIDYKLPWLNFSTMFFFNLKPIYIYKSLQKLLLFDNCFFYTLAWKNSNQIERIINPQGHTVLTWLQSYNYFSIENKVVTVQDYVESFFTNFSYINLTFLLNFSTIDIFKLLPILNKIVIVKFLAWKNRYRVVENFSFNETFIFVSNDVIFFWPFFTDFDTSKVIFFLPWKWRGWPKKITWFFFDSEEQKFEHLSTATYFLSTIDKFWMFQYNYELWTNENFCVPYLLYLFIYFFTN